MSPKGRRHAALSEGWGTGYHCKTEPLPLPPGSHITLTVWQALGGLPLQSKKQGSTTTTESKQ